MWSSNLDLKNALLIMFAVDVLRGGRTHLKIPMDNDRDLAPQIKKTDEQTLMDDADNT
jgi:hypothetical protein